MNTLQSIQCPYCWEALEIQLEAQEEAQQFTEDCHVCCRPILVRSKYNQLEDAFSTTAEKEL